MYHLIAVSRQVEASISRSGTLPALADYARMLAKRWGDPMVIRIYRFDGTSVAERARRVRLPRSFRAE